MSAAKSVAVDRGNGRLGELLDLFVDALHRAAKSVFGFADG